MSKLNREEIAAEFMVQCEKGEPFECPHLATCPHEDKDICLWQYESADKILAAHDATVREIFKELEKYNQGVQIIIWPEDWQTLKQKYLGGE